MSTFNKNTPKYKTTDFEKWFSDKFAWLYKIHQFGLIAATDRTIMMFTLGKKDITSTDYTEKRYHLYKLDIYHQFVKIMDSTHYDDVYKEYQRRFDSTVDLTLYAKIHLIADVKIKDVITNIYNNIRDKTTSNKFNAIASNVSLSLLSNMTTTELVDYTQNVIDKNEANDVFWEKFLKVN